MVTLIVQKIFHPIQPAAHHHPAPRKTQNDGNASRTHSQSLSSAAAAVAAAPGSTLQGSSVSFIRSVQRRRDF